MVWDWEEDKLALRWDGEERWITPVVLCVKIGEGSVWQDGAMTGPHPDGCILLVQNSSSSEISLYAIYSKSIQSSMMVWKYFRSKTDATGFQVPDVAIRNYDKLVSQHTNNTTYS